MAATVHSDPYAIFLRKIGYSVGLEYTAERVKELAARYLQDRDVTVASWHELVTGSKDTGNWGRDASAEKHIGDFFYSLRLIQRTPGDVLVLENLDAMAICAELLEGTGQDAAWDFLLLWAIVVNDGEIFLNLLLADFEEHQIKDRLRAMMGRKTTDLLGYLRGKVSAERIRRVIRIERQEKNRGSAGWGQSVVSLKRTGPLQPTSFSAGASDVVEKMEFSDDYFRKVPPRRRDWAVSLGLWDGDKGITGRGRYFVDELRRSGYIDSNGGFTFWPMDYELVRSGLRPDLFGDNTRSLWACLVDLGTAYSGVRVKPPSAGDADRAVELVSQMMDVFRSLHVRKAMLRRELPLTIAYPAAVALACARAEPVVDLPAAISTEQKSEQRRVALRQSRNTGGALSVKR